MYMYMHISASELTGQKCFIFHELELQGVVSCLMWLLGIELRSSRRTTSTLNH